MEVADGQQFGLALGEPLLGGGRLAPGAVSVAAAVVGNDGIGEFSQRATCPPSAIVRQRSMADITFIWSRLTCPALALRHAAPWSRKISATSNAGRDTRRLLCRRRVSPALLGLLARLRQQVERAFDAGDHAGCDTRVTRRGVQFVMTEQRLDNSDVARSSRWVAKLWRNACSVTAFLIPAALAAW